MLEERWLDERWHDPDYRNAHADEVEHLLERLLLKLTRAEIYVEGQRRRMPLAPVRTLDEVFADDLLHEREFFVDLHHPDLDAFVTVPGAPYKLSETPWRIARPAPTLGQHNEEIFGALGIDHGELERLREQGVV
jgi:crotonobetainyl-CoA:carnitine CoA-transferase CaiB-like acyl-CoA transferase